MFVWCTEAMDEKNAVYRMSKAMRGAVHDMRADLYQNTDPEVLPLG
jgi:hypothetical protein